MTRKVETISRKVFEGAIDAVEEYICDHETDTVKAQGMAAALDMIEKYVEEHNE